MLKTRTALFNQDQKLEKFECELEAQEFLELTKHELWVFKNSSSIMFFLIKSCFLTWIVMVFSYLQINKNTPLEPKGPCALVRNWFLAFNWTIWLLNIYDFFLCYVLAWSIKRKLTFKIWLSIFRWVKRNLSITIILSIGRHFWQSRYVQEEALIEQFRGGRFMTISSLSAKSFKGVSSLSIGNRSPQSVKTWNI